MWFISISLWNFSSLFQSMWWNSSTYCLHNPKTSNDGQSRGFWVQYCIKRSTSIFSFCRCHKRGVTVERVAAWEAFVLRICDQCSLNGSQLRYLHRQIRRNHYEALNKKSTLTGECTRGAGIILTGYCSGWISSRDIEESGVSDYFQHTRAVGEASISHRSWYRPILWIETCKYNC